MNKQTEKNISEMVEIGLSVASALKTMNLRFKEIRFSSFVRDTARYTEFDVCLFPYYYENDSYIKNAVALDKLIASLQNQHKNVCITICAESNMGEVIAKG
jgi:hypothetical protein